MVAGLVTLPPVVSSEFAQGTGFALLGGGSRELARRLAIAAVVDHPATPSKNPNRHRSQDPRCGNGTKNLGSCPVSKFMHAVGLQRFGGPFNSPPPNPQDAARP